MIGHVDLVGAGCGGFDLITLRGKSLLGQCDAVVYDALIDKRLLDFAPQAERFCVGKRAGQHSARQEEIHTLLVSLAAAGRHVVRLKGGDPFVFGRGGEEITALQAAGIPFRVIPGISSCIAVPALAGIPVTHRLQSRSFHVITGRTADGSDNFTQYAKLHGTLVFLMGLRSLPQITAELMQGGMSGDTPAAVISQGGSLHQRTVRGTLRQIAALASELPPPAVTVIGENAALHFEENYHTPLAGISVTVTGTAAFTARVREVLAARGAAVFPCPHLQTVPVQEIPPLQNCDCIALTGRNGAERFLRHLHDTKTDLRSLAGIRFAVIGTGTASVLEQAGIFPEIIPADFTAEALAREIVRHHPQHVLLLRAAKGSPVLPQILTAHGIPCTDTAIYDTVPNPAVTPEAVGTDFLVFGSAFGVQSFFAQGFTASAHTKIICIGRQTASAFADSGTSVITANPHTAEGIADAMQTEVTHETLSQTQSIR